MGTLTWTVWLLFAFTALASNVEVEAVPDHERDVGRVGYLCDHKQVPDLKTELSSDQRILLQAILAYLEMDVLPTVMGDFTFNGRRIPIDFIFTYLFLGRSLADRRTVEELWGIIQLYEYYEKKAESEPRTRDISKYEHVTALFIKKCGEKRGGYNGKICIDGDIFDLYCPSLSYPIKNSATSQIIKEIKSCPRNYPHFYMYSSMREQPDENDKERLNVIIEFLKTQGTNATGSFMFGKHRISLQFIEWYLVQHGRSIKSYTSEELWRIIRAYIPESEEFNRLPEKEKAVLRDILNYLKFLGDGARGEVTFKSHTLSIDFIMTVVHLQGADIFSLTVGDLWELIKMYEVYEKKPENRPENRYVSKNEHVTLLYAITYLRNDGGVTGQIVIDGVKIPVSYLLNQLKIRGKDFRTVTIEQIHISLSAYLSKYTPPTRVPLGTQPTDEQTLELRALIDLLKTERSPAVGSFIFSGYRTSVQFILSYMDQHGLSIDNLNIKELWSIMLLHESNETNTNTAVSVMPGSGTRAPRTNECGTVPTEPHINGTLHRILEQLLPEGKNATGYIEFGGRNISLQFTLTDLSMKHIDVRKATAADL